MKKNKRLQKVYEQAERVPFNKTSKIVLMSDCHRGNGSLADNFSPNKNLYFAALTHYWFEGYTYIELGDGDELWANKSMNDILLSHGDVFWRMQKFYKDKRFYMLYGNHDMEKKKHPKKMEYYYDEEKRKCLSLFPGIKVHEAIVLKHTDTKQEIFLLHGHQGDLLNDAWWKLGRFLVRYIWRPLELVGVHDPFSASKNIKLMQRQENRLSSWAEEEQKILVAGHTHRAVFAMPDEIFYFNDGCCVNPSAITAIEITLNEISLVKWRFMTRRDGTVFVGKRTVNGPVPLSEYHTK